VGGLRRLARSRHEVVANQADFLAKPATNGTAESPPAYDEDEEPF
jgi:hypothetical protein